MVLPAPSAGSAAGVSAGFGAPIAGAFFAVEAVLQPSSSAGRASDPPSLTSSMVLLAAVLATVVSRAGLGSEPTFLIPDYDLSSFALLPLYLPLGLLSGVTSVLFTRVSSYSAGVAKIYAAPMRTGGLGVPTILLPPLGGLFAGSVALLYPEILYQGFDNVDAILANTQTGIYPAALLFQLVAAKILTTAVCKSSGLVGGIYAPSLFMGAALVRERRRVSARAGSRGVAWRTNSR